MKIIFIFLLFIAMKVYSEECNEGDVYKYVPEAKSFNEANLECMNEYGTTLATITTFNEFLEVQDLCSINDRCWIGLTNINSINGDATWLSGITPVETCIEFTEGCLLLWEDDVFENNCGAINGRFFIGSEGATDAINDIGCQDKLNYVCDKCDRGMGDPVPTGIEDEIDMPIEESTERKEASPQACFNAIDPEQSTMFGAPQTGTVIGIELEHISGSVSCAGTSDSSPFGCKGRGLFTFLYDCDPDEPNRILPKEGTTNENDVIIKFGPQKRNYYFNSIDNEHDTDPLILMGPNFNVQEGDQFKLQYSEAIEGVSTHDNVGTSCAKVTFIYQISNPAKSIFNDNDNINDIENEIVFMERVIIGILGLIVLFLFTGVIYLFYKCIFTKRVSQYKGFNKIMSTDVEASTVVQ